MREDFVYNGKAIMCRTRDYKYVKRLYELDELYDLKRDPQEVHNLVDDPAYQPVLEALRERLLTHYLDTSDVVPFQKDARIEPSFAAPFRLSKKPDERKKCTKTSLRIDLRN